MNLYESIKLGLKESSDIDLASIIQEIKQTYISECKASDMRWGANTQREYHEPYWDFDETLDNTLVIDIEWGDWKHDHNFCDSLVKKVAARHGLDVHIDTDVYEEDGSDCYSANHICKFSGKYKDSESPKNLVQKAKDLTEGKKDATSKDSELPKENSESPKEDLKESPETTNYPDWIIAELSEGNDVQAWYCPDCDTFFKEPKYVSTDMENYYGVGSDFPDHHYQGIPVCPNCDKDNLEEVYISFDSLVDDFLSNEDNYQKVYEEISNRHPEYIKSSDTLLEDIPEDVLIPVVKELMF